MDNYKNFISEIPTTALDVYQMLPEGTRCEVISNELIMSPSPSKYHQLILIKITNLLFNFLEEKQTGTLLTAPFDVYFEGEKAIVQPDIFVVLNEDEHIIKKNGVYGVPSLIIEIVSTNRAYDTKRKKSLYERAGVKEYFIIDPQNKETTLFTLNSELVYGQSYKDTGIITSKLLACNLFF